MNPEGGLATLTAGLKVFKVLKDSFNHLDEKIFHDSWWTRFLTRFSSCYSISCPGGRKWRMSVLILWNTSKIIHMILYENIKYWRETSIYTNITNNNFLNFGSHCTNWTRTYVIPAIFDLFRLGRRVATWETSVWGLKKYLQTNRKCWKSG